MAAPGVPPGAEAVEAYISAAPAAMHEDLRWLRGLLQGLLPGHLECISYAMPGLRAPGKGGKMVAGYAAFARHIGLYPHSGNIIARIDCRPFATSKSGVTFRPGDRPPEALVAAIVRARQAELAGA